MSFLDLGTWQGWRVPYAFVACTTAVTVTPGAPVAGVASPFALQQSQSVQALVMIPATPVSKAM